MDPAGDAVSSRVVPGGHGRTRRRLHGTGAPSRPGRCPGRPAGRRCPGPLPGRIVVDVAQDDRAASSGPPGPPSRWRARESMRPSRSRIHTHAEQSVRRVVSCASSSTGRRHRDRTRGSNEVERAPPRGPRRPSRPRSRSSSTDAIPVQLGRQRILRVELGVVARHPACSLRAVPRRTTRTRSVRITELLRSRAKVPHVFLPSVGLCRCLPSVGSAGEP